MPEEETVASPVPFDVVCDPGIKSMAKYKIDDPHGSSGTSTVPHSVDAAE
jgi:hypothetical protein